MTETAEMRDIHAQLNETVTNHSNEDIRRVGTYLEYLWQNPDDFEQSSNVDKWRDDHVLTLVELGVLFGIEYERAYPTGRNDEWPISKDRREAQEPDHLDGHPIPYGLSGIGDPIGWIKDRLGRWRR